MRERIATTRGDTDVAKVLDAEVVIVLDLWLAAEPAHMPRPKRAPRAPLVRVACARERAFWFTYPETLIALREAGVELIPFSPLHDTALSADIAGLWIGGGYPEDFAPALEANVAMRLRSSRRLPEKSRPTPRSAA